jgi:hypothetical protein
MQSEGESLPNPFYAVAVEYRISADQRDVQLQRLRRQQPVEWVVMVKGE